MPRLLPSSAESRIRRCRGDITLSIFLRRGAAWDAVDAFRSAWGVKPVTAANYIAGDSQAQPIFFPENLPSQAPESPFPASDPDDRAGFIVLPFELTHDVHDPIHAAWYRDLKRLHDLIVPAGCRSFLPIPAASWITFLSGCICADPPPDQLLEYASSTVLMDLPPIIDPAGEPSDLESAKHAMIHAPILALRDDVEIEHAYIAFYESVFGALARAVQDETGIDIRRRRNQLIDEQPELFDGLQETLRNVSKRLVITVDEYTTQEDVANAFRLIRESNPAANDNDGRPSRHPLQAVQCAIWSDRFHWSHERIANRFGWSVQRPPAQSPRSETVRNYVNEGRRIIQENAPT